jgi:outer membrane protein assembly factor BamB
MNDASIHEPNDTAYHAATRIAGVAGVAILVISALLLYDYSRRMAKDPLEDSTFNMLKLTLDQQPTNEALKTQIRELDLQLRREYFRQRAFAGVGCVILIVATVAFLLSLKVAATLRRRLPTPAAASTPEDTEDRWTSIARWAVVGVCLLLVAVAVVLSVTIRSELYKDQKSLADVLQLGVLSSEAADSQAAPTGAAASAPSPAAASPVVAVPAGTAAPAAATSGVTAAATASETPPSNEEAHKMWPRFRGPDGLGISAFVNVPETWDAKSGKNILWKTPVPLKGYNSPVVWGKRVFLSGADQQRREVYCFDADHGKLLWQQTVPSTPQSTARTLRVGEDTGYASSTTATDGRRVFAIFANGDLAAFDVAGKLAWSKSLGIPENSYGYASSLCMVRNLLIVQFDQGATRTPRSKLFALDSATGKVVWQAERPVPNSWSTPIVIRHGNQEQIITSGDPWVIAYRPADGVELWRAKCLRTDIAPSPVFADGKVFVANDNAVLSAIRVDGKGDVTATHIAWKGEDGMPDTSSPLATKEYVFLLASFGTLTCYDAVKGAMLWSQDLEGSFSSSPSLAGNRLYLQSKEGKAYVVEPGREKCKRIGEAELGEECVTSPAFQDGRIYLRGAKHLFCIGKP